MDYTERVLIKLRREYGRDEVVAALYKLVSDRDLEIGKLRSEVDYLEQELKVLRDDTALRRQARLALKRDQEYIRIKEHNKLLEGKLKQMRVERDVLLSKLYAKQGSNS